MLLLDNDENVVDGGVTMMHLGAPRKYHYVLAPDGIDRVEPGSRLKVIKQFVTDKTCPLGSGLTCLHVENGIIAVFAPHGVAWFRSKNM